MINQPFPLSELTQDAVTESILDLACFAEPVNPQTAEDVISGIEMALRLDEHPAFLEGLSERLTQLGTACTPEDTSIMLTEVKRRYKSILGKLCPRTVLEWIRGTTPGVTNRQNHYDLCYALEMDERQTAAFFQKYFLTLPWGVKSRIDAVFLYCLHHGKPYSDAEKLITAAEQFPAQEVAHTATAQIYEEILKITDETAFLEYLSRHCYNNEQQFQRARQFICEQVEFVKQTILADSSIEVLSPERLGSQTIAALLGYRYQRVERSEPVQKLPKRFTESLPNDVTLGRILNGKSISYEALRKTVILLKFYHFYCKADNTDRQTICENLLDFMEELNVLLIECGFAQLHVRHPFDCLLLYCSNSYDPILTLHLLNERN